MANYQRKPSLITAAQYVNDGSLALVQAVAPGAYINAEVLYCPTHTDPHWVLIVPLTYWVYYYDEDPDKKFYIAPPSQFDAEFEAAA